MYHTLVVQRGSSQWAAWAAWQTCGKSFFWNISNLVPHLVPHLGHLGHLCQECPTLGHLECDLISPYQLTMSCLSCLTNLWGELFFWNISNLVPHLVPHLRHLRHLCQKCLTLRHLEYRSAAVRERTRPVRPQPASCFLQCFPGR